MDIDALRAKSAAARARYHQDIPTQAQAQQIVPNLPPPGYQRREVLAQRSDALAQQAEQASQARIVGNVDPSRLDWQNVENEIMQHYTTDAFTGTDKLNILGLDERNYAYKMVPFDHRWKFPSRHLSEAMVQGWELIPSSSEEGWNLPRHADPNTPYIGDAVLMRMPRARWERWNAARRAHIANFHRRDHQHSIVGTPGVVIAHTDMKNDPMLQRLYGGQAAVEMAPVPTLTGQHLANTAAQSLAFQELTDQLRAGTLQGVVPGQQTYR